ncbi:Phthiocerol synthesis polyketide synthase type I PpsA [Mycolicibacterium vanbaalenii]|uniref:Phthiocerol synthesis polyketide synthase type I PpsA n=1 Tax=Mycolicibacterium vanbaalenii TaxID=110539 RepID=A0A5S9PSH8_MYCVN|nr:type I polyketide synthase [Mycolicibacterium vanbaalenii]CAA0107127.1 Phthiocerol synthesis polyketide synthase type I PpsA [Mycolicibacterium vanbaalenii]
MTSAFDEDSLRNWLVDYLVTNIGCSPDEIDFDAPLNDLAVGSSDAVVLTGELSELLGRTVSPVEFWQYPTINALAKFLTGGEVEAVADASPAHRSSTEEPIAVIGLGCRFPGDIHGPDELWEFLEQGRSAVSEVPSWRWKWFDDGTPEGAAAMAGTTRWGSFLSDIDQFDAEYFEISPSEADKMDPQQRLLLEVTHEAIEHAGIRPDALRHTQTGVFTGACLGEYAVMASMDLTQVNAYSGTGGALSVISNRVSYYYDLRGPSVTVDTACSSSLVAVHLACQSLRTGDSDLALAAGVNVLLSPAVTRSFDEAEAMSQSGRCHAFDARADGFVRGEGCGVAVLKRLSEAQRDGDRILAVVRGSAVNQDGRSNGLMAPNPAAQMAVLRTAYTAAGLEPREVDYVEAHGTGTLLGDPIEARALGTVLGRGRTADAPLLIGAIKSNLGHTEAAAGIAGFAKTVLALQHGRLPANLGYETPNPHIPFDKLRLKVVAEPTDWAPTGRPRRAGVSSFGFGGTNAHIVLEQAPAPVSEPAVVDADEPSMTTLVVSGKTPQRIAATAATLAEWMAGPGASATLPQIAHALNHHRGRQAKFATVCARDRDSALAGLQALAAGQSAPGVVGPHDGSCRPGTVFVYSGQGSQWAGMGRQLLVDEPAFAAAVAELEPTFVEQVGFSLRQVLAGGEPVTGIARIQPVLVGVQLALTQMWRSYGVHPDAVIGHSMGEVAAVVVAGALSTADGLRVIATRSRLMSRLSGQGAMALIELDPDAAAELIADRPDITLAVYASPRQTVIAGPPDQVDAVMAEVAAMDRLARRIEVDVASHHPTIDPILPELRAALQDLAPATPTIPLITTTREHDGPEPVFDADYWVDNLRNPVRFHQAVAAAGAEHGVFVEVAPHPLLTYGISDTLGTAHHHAVPTLLRDTDETLTFHTHLNSTFTTQPPDTVHAPEPHPELPTTPWAHTKHWVQVHKPEHRGGSAPRSGTLLGERSAVATTPPTHLWQARLVREAKPYPGFHRIQGVEVVPMSVLLRTLSVAAAECGASRLSDLRFEHPIVVGQPQVIQVVVSGETITVSSAPSADAAAHRWVRHVSAVLGADTAADEPEAQTGEVRGAERGYDRSTVDELQAKWGVEGQPFPWSIQTCQAASGALRADVDVPDASSVALLDAAVQIARLTDITDERLLVPAGAEAVSVTGELTDTRAVVTVRPRSDSGDDLVVDVDVTVPDGSAEVAIRGLRYVDVQAGPAQPTSGPADPRTVAHALDWQPWVQESVGKHPTTGTTLAVLGDGDTANALRDGLVDAGYSLADEAEAACVVYVPDAGPDDSAESDFECAARLTGEVAELVRRLAGRNQHTEPRLWIVTEGVRDARTARALRQSCLWGVAGVIGAEEPQLWGGLVDIAAPADIGACASAMATVLPVAAKSILVLDNGQFLSPTLTTLAERAADSPHEAVRCRPDAAYLITGGMGALGLLTADWLADRGARRLVLAGRTSLPPRREWQTLDGDARAKTDAIRALEKRGVSVEVAALDIGSREALTALLAKRDDEGAPPIRGVVHTAGLTDSQLLTDIATDRLRQTMWPKVAGAELLDEVFPADSVDFLYLTASAGTVFGVPGQGAYAAGNAYLDCLARGRHRRGGRTVSLDWVAWQGLGFGSDAQVVVDELQRFGSRPIRPEEAFAAWEYVSTFDVPHVVMAPMPSADDAVSAESATGPAQVPVWSEMSAEEVQTVLEDGLRAIMANELRIAESEVETDRPFAEMGLNSVMAMSIRREVEQLAGVELSATMLWNHPTIGSLAIHLADKVAPDTEPHQEGDAVDDSSDSLLDSLFDSIESN